MGVGAGRVPGRSTLASTISGPTSEPGTKVDWFGPGEHTPDQPCELRQLCVNNPAIIIRLIAHYAFSLTIDQDVASR